MKALWLVVLVGCAKGSSVASDGPNVVDSPEAVDSPVAHVDASHADGAMTDGAMTDASADASIMIDAAKDAAMVDAPPMIDAATADATVDAVMIDAANDAAVMVDACVPVTTELLLNPAFDLTPRGVSWIETPFNTTLNLITNDVGTPAALSAPYRAWLGGVMAANPGETATDQLSQTNIAIPANTTQLEISGFYAVGSAENPAVATVYDTGDVALTTTAGTLIEDVLQLSNRTVTSIPWTALDHVFTANLSGQTVRLRFLANNDFSNPTSFFFDSMSLKATHCP